MSWHYDHSILLLFVFGYTFCQSLHSNLNVSLVHNHELRIYLKHHGCSFLKDLVSKFEVVILIG